MNRRSFTLTITAVFILVSCRLASPDNIVPTATPSLAATDVPETQALDITETSTAEILILDWTSKLEVLQSGNWSRLQLLKSFPAEMPLGSAIAISPDGKTMAVGSQDGAKILFFDVASGQLLQTVSMGPTGVGEYSSLIGMEYLPDGTIILNSSGPYAIYHIDAAGNVLARWDGSNFATTADQRIMAHHTGEDGIVLVEIASNTPLTSLDDGDAMFFSFSPDGSKIAAEDVGVDYLHVEIWDIPNRTILTTLEEVANPRFSPNGRFLAVTSYDYENDTTPLKIFSSDGATELIALDVSELNGLSNRAPLWSIDGSLIAAQIANGSPAAWDTTNWQPLQAPALEGELYAFSPDGHILITRAPDGSILLWGVSH